MATHSGILAWRIPWTEEPGELQSVRLPGHDRAMNTFTLSGSKHQGFAHIRHLKKKRKDESNHFTGFDTFLDGRGHI